MLEYTQFTKNKEMPKEIIKSLMDFLKNKGYECALKNDLKKVTYGQLREELMTVLNPPVRIQDIYRRFPWNDNETAYHVRWYLEIDPTHVDAAQSFLNSQITDYTFPLLLVEDVDVLQ
ncbi:hypothetical protein AWU65_01780 [Paenibacillus glucanolyticus]|uniref:Uncharacterized protein n=2 Tax=Paenibacillus glucanolyticus TaxID=59843 RepID=A0A163G5P4_9BACL|nr:hypothetical protein [Paenibacillus glucanolyticus]KZS44745.1 hypothetical protein AWU65_01780 [Paenibacillus glucanolyticus]OMF64412.1 hypothetical protein BK142_32015 [Paenibacillus glucanolyticus]